MIRDRIDVEKDGTRNVLVEIFRAGITILRRQVKRAVDDDEVRIAEVVCEPLGGFEPGQGGCHFLNPSVRAQTSAMRTRRFCLPFFSMPVTCTLPISPVDCTCVPPQGCRSNPSISIRRTRPVPIGGFTDMVLTRLGLAASSSSLIQRAV